MSDKEALDRLASNNPGYFLVDDFPFNAINIVSTGDGFKVFKIVCEFTNTNQALQFIRLINKKHFHFCVPGWVDCEKARCIYWKCFDPTGVFDYPCCIWFYISLKDLEEDMTDEEKRFD